MSADDNFLARWSRRKQAVKGTDALTPVENAELAAPPLGAETGSAPLDQGQLEEVPPTEVLPPLPRIEDLTAESDISGFLRKGVPETLRHAALRRAWSLDPAIRDYISPADYAWDFNDPRSIPGFGGDIGSTSLDAIVAHSTGGRPPPLPGAGEEVKPESIDGEVGAGAAESNAPGGLSGSSRLQEGTAERAVSVASSSDLSPKPSPNEGAVDRGSITRTSLPNDRGPQAPSDASLQGQDNHILSHDALLSRDGRGRLVESRAGEGHERRANSPPPSPGSELRSDSASPVPGEEETTHMRLLSPQGGGEQAAPCPSRHGGAMPR